MRNEANLQPDGSALAARATPVRTVLVTAAVFGTAYAAAGVAFLAFAIFGHSHRGDSMGQLWGNFLMAGYLTVVGSILNTIAFVVLVACSVHWRRLSPLGAAGRSAVFGVAAFAITMTGLQYHMLRVVPIMKLLPVFAVWLPYVLPGILMGSLAVVAIWVASFGSKGDHHQVLG